MTVTESQVNVGQNNTRPVPMFNNHFFMQLTVQDPGQAEKIIYYDASYGKTYTSLADMEAKAIAGFYTTSIPNEIMPRVRSFKMKMNDPNVTELFALITKVN